MQKKIVKIAIWSIIWIVIAFIGWQALLIANVYMAKKTARMMIGREYYMHDYYYADISNITYTGHNFLLYVQKPLLFSPKHFYLYSSKDGVTWKRVLTSMFGGLEDAVPIQRIGQQQIFDESGIVYSFGNKKCLHHECSFSYGYYLVNFPAHSDNQCSIYYQISPNSAQYVELLNSSNCETNWHVSKTEEKLFPIPDQESYPAVNLKSFMVLRNLVKKSNLNVSLGIPHTTYGNGKYVGIYKQVNAYYLIISSDGVHYEIKELPSDVTSSLAISIFGK